MSYKNDPVVDRRESDDRRIRWFARASIAFAVLLAVGEAVRNWGDWQWWPFWLVDYITAGLLFFGGRYALKESDRTARESAGWCFWIQRFARLHQFFWAFVRHKRRHETAQFRTSRLTAIIGVLFVFALGAFLWLLPIAMRVSRSRKTLKMSRKMLVAITTALSAHWRSRSKS